MGRRKAVSKREGEVRGSKRMRTSSNPKKDEKEAKGKSTGKGKAAESSTPEAPACGDGMVHPLLIPHVLENIFQHFIPTKTEEEEYIGSTELSKAIAKNVQNFRLVCKQWKDTVTRLYLRKRRPTMAFGFDVPSLKGLDEEMENLLDVMKTSNLIPFQRYSLQPYFYLKENEQLMKDFMRICGPSAAELDLYTENDRTMKFTLRCFPNLNLSSLKALSFTFLENRYANRGAQEIAYFIKALLGAAETLTEFGFYDGNLGGITSQAIIQQFGECISKRLPKTVKILHLRVPVNDSHLITLAERELKLEEFDFNVHCGASSLAIRKFFESQTATLKILRIIDKCGGPPSSVALDFPRFDELLQLGIHGGTIPELFFPNTFPKVASLNLAGWKNETSYSELLETNCRKKSCSLKEIHLPHNFPQGPLVKKAAQCFPNISKLHINRAPDISETLQETFVYFPNIEELYISFSKWGRNEREPNADSIFSGVSEQDCRRISKGDSLDNVDIGAIQHRPSILNLTKLKKLSLEHLFGSNGILTDFTAHFIFLKMASLKELQTHQFQMSTKYLNLLREKLILKLDDRR